MTQEKSAAIFECLLRHRYGITAKDMAAKINESHSSTSTRLSKLAAYGSIAREKIIGRREFLYKPNPKAPPIVPAQQGSTAYRNARRGRVLPRL